MANPPLCGSSLADHTPETLAAWLRERGFQAFRAKQILNWFWQQLADDYAEMTNLPKPLREALDAEDGGLQPSPLSRGEASDDGHGTTKYLFTLADGHGIETVLIRHADRRTVCVSSQAGCAMGCRFCASGLLGLERNLTVGEIVEQVRWAQQVVRAEAAAGISGPARVTNVVLMGTGEPFANLDAVLAAVETWLADWGLGLSARRVTLSTVGVPTRGFERLAAFGHPVKLAVSLHAPDDVTRARLIPAHDSSGGLDAILQAMRAHFERTGREPTVEYTLIAGVNDRPDQARTLADALRRTTGGRARVNLIPYNPVPAFEWQPPAPKAVQAFADTLCDAGIRVTQRKRMGRGIDGACGQLRLSRRETD